MKILHICNDYYHTNIYQNIHQQLMLNKVDSTMLVPLKNNESDKSKEEGVVQAKCFNKIDRFSFFYKQTKILNAVKKQIENNKPEVLHAHFVFSAGYLSMKIKQEYNIPYVVAVQNTDVNVFFKWVIHLRKIGIQVLLNADKVIFISQSYRDFVINKYIPKKYQNEIMNKSIILPFGVENFWLENTVRKTRKRNDRKLHLITVGVINQNKNQLTVAKVASELKNRGYNVKYTVIGKVKEKKVYHELMKYSFVNYIASKPRDKLLKYYRQADILVLPSVTESFGLVYAEAISQGLPVIYTKGQGFDRQFDDGIVGYSVVCFDVEEITMRIIDIIDNYSEVSNRCVDNCNKFEWDAIVKKYIHFYNDIQKN